MQVEVGSSYHCGIGLNNGAICELLLDRNRQGVLSFAVEGNNTEYFGVDDQFKSFSLPHQNVI